MEEVICILILEEYFLFLGEGHGYPDIWRKIPVPKPGLDQDGYI